jgi:hypothetical protein
MEDRRARVARSMRALTSVIITRKILDPALDSHNVTIFYLAAGKRRMDAKPRELVVLATLALLCALFAWTGGHPVWGPVFSALGVVAVLSAALTHWR